MNSQDKERLVILGRRILRALAVIQTCMVEAMSLLTRPDASIPGPGAMDNLLGTDVEPTELFRRPLVDDAGMAVVWRGERCPLGYSRLLDLVDRLVRNPGAWIPYKRLLRETWNQPYLSEGTVKVAVARLKKRLSTHGMAELANMIHTSGHRCGYFPNGKPE
jgi:hypothetical protein